MGNERIIELTKELMSEMEKAGLYKFDGSVSSISIFEIQLDSGYHKVSIDSSIGEETVQDVIEFDVTE